MRKTKQISLGKASKYGLFFAFLFGVGFVLGNTSAIAFCSDVAVRTLQKIGADKDIIDRLIAYVEYRI